MQLLTVVTDKISEFPRPIALNLSAQHKTVISYLLALEVLLKMPAMLEGVGRKLGNLVARMKARNEGNGHIAKRAEQDGEQVTSEAVYDQNTPAQGATKSLLQYVSATWEDDESIADTNSTRTRVKLQAMGPQESSSVHAKNDPSYKRNSPVNDAVQQIYSVPDPRSEPSLYYLDNGRLRSTNPREKQDGQSHPYRYGSSRARPVPGNIFPVTETVGPDWRLHALGRNKAGHWSMQDFSEQHLADRLFYNANIIAPVDHLAGSQKAAAQDLKAIHMENQALRQSSSRTIAKADHLEMHIRKLHRELKEIDMDIETLRSSLNGGNDTVGVVDETEQRFAAGL